MALQTLTYASKAGAQMPLPPSTAPDQLLPPRLLEAAAATYPEQALSRGLEATVLLGLSIDEQGQVTAADVLEPAGHGFDEAAREAALRFRFEPARRAGAPIAAKIRYPFAFELPAAQPAAEPAVAPEPVAVTPVAAEPIVAAPPPAPAGSTAAFGRSRERRRPAARSAADGRHGRGVGTHGRHRGAPRRRFGLR
jgi:TonB family protein